MEDQKKTNWQPTANRFVAYLDIMGFSDMVMRKSHDEIYQLLSGINSIKTQVQKVEKIERFLNCENYVASFSDSIIIFSKDDSPVSYDFFLYAVNYLFTKTINSNIPLKGALAYGNISVNKTQQIYFGQALIDAYLLEEEVEYYGVVAHHTIVDYFENNKALVNNDFFFESPTALKSGTISHSNCDWFKDFFEIISESKIEMKLSQFTRMMSGRPRRYLDNTYKMLEHRNRYFEDK